MLDMGQTIPKGLALHDGKGKTVMLDALTGKPLVLIFLRHLA